MVKKITLSKGAIAPSRIYDIEPSVTLKWLEKYIKKNKLKSENIVETKNKKQLAFAKNVLGKDYTAYKINHRCWCVHTEELLKAATTQAKKGMRR